MPKATIPHARGRLTSEDDARCSSVVQIYRATAMPRRARGGCAAAGVPCCVGVRKAERERR